MTDAKPSQFHHALFLMVACLSVATACGDDDTLMFDAGMNDADAAVQDGGSDVAEDVAEDVAIDVPPDVRADAESDTALDVEPSDQPTITLDFIATMTPSRQLRVTGEAVDASDAIESVSLEVGGVETEAVLSEGRFEAFVVLQPGSNTITATATDSDGDSATDDAATYYGHRVSVGNSQGAALRADALLTWGRNELGQLGNGTLEGSEWDDDPETPELPVRYEVDLDDVVSIVTRQTFMIALKSDGTVWTWGSNSDGQLGYVAEEDCGSRGTSACRRTPTQVPGIEGAVGIAAGFDHSLVLLEDGTALSFGANDYGQLGRAGDPLVPAPITGLNDIVQLAAGSTCSYAVTADGRVIAWGENDYGQLGVAADDVAHAEPAEVSGLSEIVSVAAGNATLLALTADGLVWSVGRNRAGQLGVGDEELESSSSPLQVMRSDSAALEDVVLVTGDGFLSGAVTSAGEVYTWGLGSLGQLGQGDLPNGDRDLEDRYFASQVVVPAADASLFQIVELEAGAGGPMLARNPDGYVFGWGWSFRGSLGLEGALNAWAYSTPVLVLSATE